MQEHSTITAWAEELVRQHSRQELLTGGAMVVFAGLALFVTTFVALGLFFALGIVLGVLGIAPPHPSVLAPIILLIQCGLLALTKPREAARISVEQTEDTGEIIVVKPDDAQSANLFYNLDGSFSFRRTFATVGLAPAIALYEAWRHFRRVAQIRRIGVEGLTRLAGYLYDHANRASLADVQRDLPDVDLVELLPRLEYLSGFIVVAGTKQSIAITDEAAADMGTGEPFSR